MISNREAALDERPFDSEKVNRVVRKLHRQAMRGMPREPDGSVARCKCEICRETAPQR